MQSIFIIAPIFILIGLGWLLNYKGLFSSLTIKENNFVLYWFAMPATLLRGILNADMGILANPLFIAAVWSPYAISILIVWFLNRNSETPPRFATLVLSTVRGNHFFAGIPIIGLSMGKTGVEAGTLILAFSLVIMQLLSIGCGQLALLGKLSRDTLLATGKQLLKNPLFMTCLFGLFLVFVGLRNLPPWVRETLRILADVSTGMALLALGASIHLENIAQMLLSVQKIVWAKLVLHPVVTWSIFSAFGLPETMIQAGTLLAAMPVAVNTAIVAQEMGMDNQYCARGIAVTTLCSLVTFPFWIHFLGLV